MFKLAVLLVVLLSVSLSKEEGSSSGQSGFITMKIAPTALKSAVPNQEDDLTKLLKQYAYQVPSDPAKAGKVAQIQEFVVPLGANVKGEEIIMKALGLEKISGGNNSTNSTSN